MLFMFGGPSHLDTFDPKPLLARDSGRPCRRRSARGWCRFPIAWATWSARPFEFRQHGESGIWISSLFPHLAQRADDLCVINSMHCSNSRHGGAVLEWHTGSDTFVRPSMGSWITYGLGSENQNFPGYVTICQDLAQGGANNFGSGFLPAVYQGTTLGHSGAEAAGCQDSLRRRRRGSPRLAAARARPDRADGQPPGAQPRARRSSWTRGSHRSSWRFASRPTLPKCRTSPASRRRPSACTDSTTPPRPTSGRSACWRGGSRSGAFASFNATSAAGTPTTTCRPITASWLVPSTSPSPGCCTDLKGRGLWDDTLVVWGGEFGRTPTCEGTDGRDHNPHGYTMWLAGGGVKAGLTWGKTDDYGYFAVEDKVHVHDLHATILHLLGLDHKRLTYRYAGRDFRLTDVHGEIVKGILVVTPEELAMLTIKPGASSWRPPAALWPRLRWPCRLRSRVIRLWRPIRPAVGVAIPPHRPLTIEGIHAYTDRVSVAAGETIRFHVSSSHPYELQVCRLGTDVDSPARDELSALVRSFPGRPFSRSIRARTCWSTSRWTPRPTCTS